MDRSVPDYKYTGVDVREGGGSDVERSLMMVASNVVCDDNSSSEVSPRIYFNDHIIFHILYYSCLDPSFSVQTYGSDLAVETSASALICQRSIKVRI